MKFFRQLFCVSFLFDELDRLVEMVIPSLKPGTIVDDNPLILKPERDFVGNVMLFSFTVDGADLNCLWA